MSEGRYGDGGSCAAGSARVAPLVEQIRAESTRIAAAEARRLRLVADFADEVSRQARFELSCTAPVPGRPDDQEIVDSSVVSEVQAVLGVSQGPATRLVDLAQRLTAVLPETLAALESGWLDLTRVRVLAEATGVVSDEAARAVQDRVLAVAGAAPWESLSPRAWRARVNRTVVRVDADAARRRRVEAVTRRAVRSWPTGDGMAEMFITADAQGVALAERVLTDLAQQRPDTDEHGVRVTMDQRRADAFVDVFRRIHEGSRLPGLAVRREREIGLVLHADTFFGDGPAADEPGEVRGLGERTYLDPVTAREQARQTCAQTSTSVLLVDGAGAVQRVVRVGPAPSGWTRQLLSAALQACLDVAPPLGTDHYTPTAPISEHVRARNPCCTAYDCPRNARACDLDHDEPWPRGPTDVGNLAPRCRRHHELKTSRLVQTRLQPDGAVDTTMLTGLRVTTSPEPLPGHAPGEGYFQRQRDDSAA